MKYLQLEPPARRLRHLAKAHVAGNLQRQDYRHARREIIEELHVDFSDSVSGHSDGSEQLLSCEATDWQPSETDRGHLDSAGSLVPRLSDKTLSVVSITLLMVSMGYVVIASAI